MKNISYFIIILFAFLCFEKASFAQQPLPDADYREKIDVLHYAIHLKIVDFSKQRISGYTELTVLPQKDEMQKLSLDLLGMTVDSVLVNETTNRFLCDNVVITIPLGFKVKTADTLKIRVYYGGKPQKDNYWGGFYFTENYAYNYGVGMAAQPPCFGRVWYPCIDGFTDRATYDYFITIEPKNKAVCCGGLVKIKLNPDKTRTYHWRLKSTIPTYLSSVAVSDYAVIQDTIKGMNGDIPVDFYVAPKDSSKALTSFSHVDESLKIYEKRFGPYRWSRVGFVGVPYHGGAMEHATNIAISNVCIDGKLTWEYLFAHELSHHWFGDLVTCRSEKDMWLNEGWASYCEAIFAEMQYGYEAYKNYNRSNHWNVLKNAHINDNGYRAVYGIPHQFTYGKTVYDKGADVVHTLRGYLGDSLFFSSIKKYLDDYAFDDISTHEFRDYLTKTTGIDMTDFFDAWLFSPGFPHFEVTQFKTKRIPDGYNVTVTVVQRLKKMPEYAKSNRIEVYFLDEKWNKHKAIMTFSGKQGEQTFAVPFKPTLVMPDMEEKIADATIDCYKKINETGNYDYDFTSFRMAVKNIEDPAFVRVTHHLIAPAETDTDTYHFSQNRYWTIEGIKPAKIEAEMKFDFHFETLDSDLGQYEIGNLVLLHRAGYGKKWKEVKHNRRGYVSGHLAVKGLEFGDYALAIKKPQ